MYDSKTTNKINCLHGNKLFSLHWEYCKSHSYRVRVVYFSLVLKLHSDYSNMPMLITDNSHIRRGHTHEGKLSGCCGRSTSGYAQTTNNGK